MTKSLDLGCGSRPKNPFNAIELFGVDVREDLEANIKKADLVIEPIPFENDFFEYLSAFDLIEHIPRIVYAPTRRNAFIELMNEVYRVLKPGGYFLSLTPAYPHSEAFRDPTHVNIITEETFPLYFDDTNRWASIYGFKGAFRIVEHKWQGPAIYAILQKVPLPDTLVTKINQKISVFIPVFNGQKYIAETLDSLLQQKFIDFEVVCVDDCSTDNSFTILQDYAAKDPRFKVFKTPTNFGSVPKVLNYSLNFLGGGYFVYSSQDDIFSVDWLEKMHSRAVETCADAVIPDLVFYYSNDQSKNRLLSGLNGDRNIQLPGKEAALHSLDWNIPGNALWNIDLIRKYKVEDFSFNADEFSVRVFFLNCNKVVFSEGVFFYRQDNDEAITKKITYKTFDSAYTQYRLYKLLKENSFPQSVIEKEALKVVSILNTLRAQLEIKRLEFSQYEIEQAELRIMKCVDCLKSDSMFEVSTTMEK